jgi:hypothetical protein
MYIFVKGYKNKNHWQQKLLWFVASQYFGMSPVCIYCCLDIWKIYQLKKLFSPWYNWKIVLTMIQLKKFSHHDTTKKLFSPWYNWNMVRTIFQLYHGENNLYFNEMMTMSALYETNVLSWIFIVLAHWNNNSLVDMSLHLDTLFWYVMVNVLASSRSWVQAQVESNKRLYIWYLLLLH